MHLVPAVGTKITLSAISYLFFVEKTITKYLTLYQTIEREIVYISLIQSYCHAVVEQLLWGSL